MLCLNSEILSFDFFFFTVTWQLICYFTMNTVFEYGNTKENPFSDGPFLCHMKINYVRWLSGCRKWWSWQINPREQTHTKTTYCSLWLTVWKNIHQSDWNDEKCLTACHFPTLILSSARTHIVIWNDFTNLSSSCACLDWSVFTYYRCCNYDSLSSMKGCKYETLSGWLLPSVGTNV